MNDDFPIIPSGVEEPPKFEVAVRDAVQRLETSVHEFDLLLSEVSQEAMTPDEWQVVEKASTDIEVSAEMAEEGYLAAAYDSHAWYRIMEHLERAGNRLDSANGILRAVKERLS